MGVIKRGILGGVSGKVANVIGGSWKGVAYLRSLPLSVANPRTTAQVAQRTKFAKAVLVAQAILAVFIKPLWDRFADTMSGFNDFVRSNLQAFNSEGVITWSNLVLGKGNLQTAGDLLVTHSLATDRLTVKISAVEPEGNGSSNDKIFCLVNRNDIGWREILFETTSPRSAEDVIFSNVTVSPGDVFHVWVCMRKADGTAVSNTSYGSLTIAG